MHFFYDEDTALQNIRKKLNQNGKILVTDLWTKEALIIFIQKCKITEKQKEVLSNISKKKE